MFERRGGGVGGGLAERGKSVENKAVIQLWLNTEMKVGRLEQIHGQP